MDEPCTNRMVPRAGSPVRAFSHKNSFWPSTVVQCSRPLVLPIFALMFMIEVLDRIFATGREWPAIGFPIYRITAKVLVAKCRKRVDRALFVWVAFDVVIAGLVPAIPMRIARCFPHRD